MAAISIAQTPALEALISQATDRAVEAAGEALERDEKRREPEEMGEDAGGEISGNPLDLSSARKALEQILMPA